MWVVVMFDLPTDTKQARRAYHLFREFLLDDGFMMLQFSVYARHSSSDDNAIVHENRIHKQLPDDGQVRVITITDKQFEKMRVFYGKTRGPTEKGPDQITLF